MKKQCRQEDCIFFYKDCKYYRRSLFKQRRLPSDPSWKPSYVLPIKLPLISNQRSVPFPNLPRRSSVGEILFFWRRCFHLRPYSSQNYGARQSLERLLSDEGSSPNRVIAIFGSFNIFPTQRISFSMIPRVCYER